MNRIVGLDVGGTNTKILLCMPEGCSVYVTESHNYKEIEARIDSASPETVVLTGGRASGLYSRLQDRYPCEVVSEMTAMCKGAEYLAGGRHRDMILVSVGTGTAFYYISADGYRRIGGSGVGGGTIRGLGRMLTGVSDYHRLQVMMELGNRERADYTSSDIYGNTFSHILPPNVIVSNFGKLATETAASTEDIASAICGIVTETVANIACQAAKRFQVKPIYYCGGIFRSAVAKREIRRYTELGKERAFFFEGIEEFVGAIGAVVYFYGDRVKSDLQLLTPIK
ncbi:BadF/BadG/BcrA/BcrD ATPase family protein [Paenibacillus xylaniclasticus]|uniref:BadF/BadG/BcrA/BcrD ATPase family protein n=1 Tax=Paenibacillus xylaniclasticus TaxID=588083 RepID=UPI000FDC3FB1|nr:MULTISPECIES: BadF/BadG/BcrA/BcrD ATPase family protein [Paenibacillus]GFN32228.1 type II pantothenate kinase [Paenibacillus curdlanolyticus]